MTNLVEPRRAADAENDTGTGAFGDGELATLVRRWMAAGTKVQERVRRENMLRVAPAPEEDEPVAEDAAQRAVEIPETTGTAETAETETVEDVVTGAEDEHEGEPRTEAEVPAAEPALLGHPALPHRPTATEVEHATRVAVLIDARRVPEGVATALLARMAQRGSVNVCRAYADWSRAELGDWVARLRLQGLHSFHQFSDDDDQALVALAIDAVDIARDAAVDEVVIAGDMTSLLPLVHRLHAAGVRVVVVGPGHTPHDVRAACDEFVDSTSIEADDAAPAGRHRA